MKSVLISIQPKWCELIASGKKTVEVRKTKPKLETPFKVYIYETQGRYEDLRDCRTFKFWDIRQKVIGEFVCDEVFPLWSGYSGNNGNDCLTFNGRERYLGFEKDGSNKMGYGWHISNLVIYDKPRELSEFVVEGDCACENCRNCKWLDRGNGYNVEDDCLLPYTNSFKKAIKPLFRPPQSWCYVESEE